ncbi:hypothetical protein CSB08_00550 [Candidatus Gracilibacteria bacterium]|nr:MAG: hypothetical protein CSB08_00550 [Candidatus Gracilibacteria bacterium]PIE85330.1 MAG: hypothetical protein CSA08_02905 [Candidatus Gracilibacteria bacterium]
MIKKVVLTLYIFLMSFGLIYANSEITQSKKITNSDFTIDTNKLFGDSKIDDGTTTTKELANKTLGTIIQNLMIAMGTISLLIMTIGAGFMIFYNGIDTTLSKGKSLFTGGIIGLLVALTSYYMVAILRFVLYKGN